MKYIIALFSLLIIFSCRNEPEQNIDSTFDPYVLSFFEEGAKRGYGKSLDEVDITIQFGDLDELLNGQCNPNSNTITIDTENWGNHDEKQRKWLVFHELGHCLLERDMHLNKRIGKGECQSIMKGIENEFECTTNLYSDLWWEYYVDELFDESAQLGNWYTEQNSYNQFVTDSILYEVDTISDEFKFEFFDISSHANFKIDLIIEDIDSEFSDVNLIVDNIDFHFCTLCSRTNARIKLNSNVVFENQNGDLQINKNDGKLSIVKYEDRLTFFFDEIMIHTFESELWNEIGKINAFSGLEPTNHKIVISKLS